VPPVKVAIGEWMRVIGAMEGTFTPPTPSGDDKTILRTRTPNKLIMYTVWHFGEDMRQLLCALSFLCSVATQAAAPQVPEKQQVLWNHLRTAVTDVERRRRFIR
jgi:hypothetical protein